MLTDGIYGNPLARGTNDKFVVVFAGLVIAGLDHDVESGIRIIPRENQASATMLTELAVADGITALANEEDAEQIKPYLPKLEALIGKLENKAPATASAIPDGVYTNLNGTIQATVVGGVLASIDAPGFGFGSVPVQPTSEGPQWASVHALFQGIYDRGQYTFKPAEAGVEKVASVLKDGRYVDPIATTGNYVIVAGGKVVKIMVDGEDHIDQVTLATFTSDLLDSVEAREVVLQTESVPQAADGLKDGRYINPQNPAQYTIIKNGQVYEVGDDKSATVNDEGHATPASTELFRMMVAKGLAVLEPEVAKTPEPLTGYDAQGLPDGTYTNPLHGDQYAVVKDGRIHSFTNGEEEVLEDGQVTGMIANINTLIDHGFSVKTDEAELAAA